jgi:predicted molibdopterin-dependent oxidoreductase YjgC
MGADWNYESAADVMQEIGEVIPFYSGASHENLTREYGRQWPCTTDHPLGTALLFAENEMDRPFKFVPVARPSNPPRNPDGFPITLVFGHSLYYWHQNVLIKHSETLKREYRLLLLDYPDGFIEINTDDAKRLDIRDGGRIRLSSAGGSLTSTARVTSEVRSGTAFVPYFVRQLKREMLGAAGDGGSLVAVRVEKEKS